MDKDQAAFVKRFGAEIRKLRLSRSMTLEDMQDYGFSAQHFQKIESGKKAISFYTAYRIAKTFGMKLSRLVKSLE